MSEVLLDKKFEYWQNQLLDLGKRNRMINYRETKRATLKLVEPEFEELFRRVAVDEEELTFQSPIDKNSDIRTYSLLSLLESLSCPIPVNIGDIKTEIARMACNHVGIEDVCNSIRKELQTSSIPT